MEEKLIIFDVDNTLIMYENDLEFFDGILLETLQIHNIPTPKKKERIELWGTGHNYPKILRGWGIKDILSFWETFDKIDTNKRMKMAKEGKITLNEDVIEVLEYLSMREVKIAALSNSNQPITNFFLDFFGISKFFSHIQGLTPEKDPYECKPEINGFQRLFSCLEFEKSSTKIVYMVGDSLTDILAAKRVGIHGILLDPKNNKINKFTDELKENEFIKIKSLKELLNIAPLFK